MSVLEEILKHKREDLKRIKSALPLQELKTRIKDTPQTQSFKSAIKRQENAPLRLIAEIKKASPSKGLIRADFNLSDIASVYNENEGVSAISVLTEEKFFQGSLTYLKEARRITQKPLLRKDFIFDEYQVYEARANSADAILLIAACLEKAQLIDLQGLARELSLDTLVEVHDFKELDMALRSDAEIIGINNRDLKTLKIDINKTFELLRDIPSGKIIVSESGISTREDVKMLESSRVDAMLVGTTIMKTKDIKTKIDELLGIGRRTL
ncbi:MAG: indole-3-glycerol phosphate synthase TrpC [Nitrospirae bacterium]|nr:indole-3-glycerol phosphate synthase TrpC [Nitrospirota bacterium]